MFHDLVVDGILAGVGNVVIFVPQIALLFLFLTVLEHIGYLARAAFLVDRVMRVVGLSGKSFVPLMSSFACAIPGIMAARTIESRRDRMVTILVAPFMSCAARLPVYLLLIAAFIPKGYRGLTLWGMYVLSLVAALLAAWLFRATLFRGEASQLCNGVALLPAAELARCVACRVVTRQDLRHRGRHDHPRVFDHPVGVGLLPAQRRPSRPSRPRVWRRARTKRPSHIGPRRRSWSRASWAALAMPSSPSSPRLASTGRSAWASWLPLPRGRCWCPRWASSTAWGMRRTKSRRACASACRAIREPMARPPSTGLVALSLMVFFVLACQCMSTLAIVKRETASWQWPLFMFAYMTLAAYLASLAVYQIGRALGWGG